MVPVVCFIFYFFEWGCECIIFCCNSCALVIDMWSLLLLWGTHQLGFRNCHAEVRSISAAYALLQTTHLQTITFYATLILAEMLRTSALQSQDYTSQLSSAKPRLLFFPHLKTIIIRYSYSGRDASYLSIAKPRLYFATQQCKTKRKFMHHIRLDNFTQLLLRQRCCVIILHSQLSCWVTKHLCFRSCHAEERSISAAYALLQTTHLKTIIIRYSYSGRDASYLSIAKPRLYFATQHC